MSLTPEQRNEAVEALVTHRVRTHVLDHDAPCRYCQQFYATIVDALAPVISKWLAAEREAGAAEVIARVEKLADEWEAEARCLGRSLSELMLRDAARDVRAALHPTTEEPS